MKKYAESWHGIRFLLMTINEGLLEQYEWQLKKGYFLLLKDHMPDMIDERHEIDCTNCNAA